MRPQVARCVPTQRAARVGNGMRSSTRWLGDHRKRLDAGPGAHLYCSCPPNRSSLLTTLRMDSVLSWEFLGRFDDGSREPLRASTLLASSARTRAVLATRSMSNAPQHFSEVVARVGNCDGARANVAAHRSGRHALKKILSWRDPDGIKEIAPFIRVTTWKTPFPVPTQTRWPCIETSWPRSVR